MPEPRPPPVPRPAPLPCPRDLSAIPGALIRPQRREPAQAQRQRWVPGRPLARPPARGRGSPSPSSAARGPVRQPGPAAASALSLYTGLSRTGGRETCRAGDSFAGLPPTRRLLCTSESAGAWEVFSFSFLSGALSAPALGVINFVTNRNDRCIDMHPESSGCFNNRFAGRAHRLLFIRYHIRY